MRDYSSKRRALLAASGALLSATLFQAKNALGQVVTASARPDPKTFQSGDLIWPKPPGAFIPYEGAPADKLVVDALELRESEWTDLKIAFIRSARTPLPGENLEEREYRLKVADTMEAMSYSRFLAAYAADTVPDEFQTYGAGQIAYVGHVALVDIDAATQVPYLVEAVYGPSLTCKSCVQRVAYDRWLAARGNALIWHGRLKSVDAATRAQVAVIAKQELGKPYAFFNMNLMDNSGFYCSKLVWYSVMKAAGFAVDDNLNPRRLIWFSPLQAMKEGVAKGHVDLLSSPGNYRNL